MGLFIDRDGRYQGWLATLLCCCAAVTEDEHPIERSKSHPTTQADICYKQPNPLTALPSSPTAAHFYAFKTDELPRQNQPRKGVDHRVPSSKPRNPDDRPSLSRQQHSSRKGSVAHTRRPSIGGPSSFRRLDYTEGQRASLIPLKLPPVVLSAAPMTGSVSPETQRLVRRLRTRSNPDEELLAESREESARAQRQKPFERCQGLSALGIPESQDESYKPDHVPSPPSPVAETRTPTRPTTLSRQSSANSLHRQALESQASSTERPRAHRKRSHQSLRRQTTDPSSDLDIDAAILELNTIVEERRAHRPTGTTPTHIAAVAPSMALHARSETLNAIGSAFARPFTAPLPPSHKHHIADTPRPRTSSRVAGDGRVSGWLTSLLPTTTITTKEPFYKCVIPTERARSDTTTSASLSSVESLAYSPTTTSKTQSSRSESRLAPIFPPPGVYELGGPEVWGPRKGEGEGEVPWPTVGLAL